MAATGLLASYRINSGIVLYGLGMVSGIDK
jgi:hypothetical protein